MPTFVERVGSIKPTSTDRHRRIDRRAEIVMVGRIARDCMAALGRTDTPSNSSRPGLAWQGRNTKYYVSSTQYMTKRLDEALAEGGTVKRDTVLASYKTIIQSKGQAAANLWLERGEQKQACERAVAIIESGANDITPKVRMFEELEALVDWAQKH